MSVTYRKARRYRKAEKQKKGESFNDFIGRRSASKALNANPFAEILIRPTYYGLETDIRDFYIAILEGFIWEAENSDHFIAVHTEMKEVKRVLGRLVLNRDQESKENGRFWPGNEGDLLLAFIDFARLVPFLWD